MYSIILAGDSKALQDAQAQASMDGALNALTASDTTAPGSLQTAKLAQALAAIVGRLSFAGSDGEKRALIVEGSPKPATSLPGSATSPISPYPLPTNHNLSP